LVFESFQRLTIIDGPSPKAEDLRPKAASHSTQALAWVRAGFNNQNRFNGFPAKRT